MLLQNADSLTLPVCRLFISALITLVCHIQEEGNVVDAVNKLALQIVEKSRWIFMFYF